MFLIVSDLKATSWATSNFSASEEMRVTTSSLIVSVCFVCTSKTKEETSGWNHPRCVKWRGAAVDVDICAVVFAFQVCTRANLGEFDGTGRLARSLNLTPGNFF